MTPPLFDRLLLAIALLLARLRKCHVSPPTTTLIHLFVHPCMYLHALLCMYIYLSIYVPLGMTMFVLPMYVSSIHTNSIKSKLSFVILCRHKTTYIS